MPQIARYELSKVKKLVSDCYFSNHRKAQEAVIAIYRYKGQPKSNAEAQAFIRNEILKLVDADFVKVSCVYDTCFADVYGKIIDGESWYIKFLVDRCEDTGEEWLEEISFHPPKDDLVLSNGTLIEKGEHVYDEKNQVWCLRK